MLIQRGTLCRGTVLVLSVVLSWIVTAAADATVADDLCAPTFDPCVVSGEHTLDDGSLIDVGFRELRVVGELRVGSGSMILRGRRVTVLGALRARGSQAEDGGSILVRAATVVVDGPIDATGAVGGRVEIAADGVLELSGPISADALASRGRGGTVAADGEVIRLNAEVTVRGHKEGEGGSIALGASANLTIAGLLDASGGDGGSVELFAGTGTAGGLAVAFGTTIACEARCTGCRGGAIRVTAGSLENRNATASVDGRWLASGKDGNRDRAGGNGGAITIDTTGELLLGPSSRLAGVGGGPDGLGGEVLLVSNGAVRFRGETDVGANGRESLGGQVFIEAGGEVEVSGLIQARAHRSGDVKIRSDASVVIASQAEIDVRTTGSSDGGNVSIDCEGTLTIEGFVQSDSGVSAEGVGGRNEFTACVLQIGPTAEVRSRGKGGANILTGRNETIVAGTLLADPDAGRNEIRYRGSDQSPLFIEGAVVEPAAEEVLDRSIRLCRPTRPVPPTATPDPDIRPTPTALRPVCAGDCNLGGIVTVNEVVLGISIGLGLQSLSRCPAMDSDADAQVAVNDLIAAVAAGLNGCPQS